jgi:PQQ-dependent dehydrogenase (s-GDH family)
MDDKFHLRFFYNLLFSQDTKKNRQMIICWILLLLVIIPISTIFGTLPIIQSTLAQTELPSTELTQEKIQSLKSNQEKLLSIQKGFSVSVLATNLSSPYNILYGPDGVLWITERVGKEITRIDPTTGAELSVMQVLNVQQSGGQDGLMGMAFDPNFNNTHYIYVAYTYDDKAGEELDLRTKITRFTYNSNDRTISEPFDLIKGLSGSVDHNSGRMTFASDGKLYYTIGDQGKNQFALYCMDIEAQDLPTQEQILDKNWDTYEGKVLRMNTDGSIPDDNPVINEVRSHIFTYGHRNAQGIAVGPNGDYVYISEHSDKSDDEVNRLQAGGNYGWPYVSGHNDDQAYQYLNWSAVHNCEDLTFNNVSPPPPSVPVKNESKFEAKNFVPPIATFYTVENEYNFTKPICGGIDFICWPTVAPSSLRLYTSDNIPGWENTLLMPTLKAGRIFHLTLNEDGTALAKEPMELFRSENRYRDIAFGPEGKTIYVITDPTGLVQAINGGGVSHDLWNPGSLLVFKYVGDGLNN